MVTATKSGVLKRIWDILGIQLGSDTLPVAVSNNIQPVVEVGNRTSNISKSGTANTTASATIYTTPANQDFFLTSLFISYVKDAAHDGTSVYAQVTNEFGLTVNWYLLLVPTTAGQDAIFIEFPYPIKLNRNSTINLNGSFTAGTSTKSLTFTGYVIE